MKEDHDDLRDKTDEAIAEYRAKRGKRIGDWMQTHTGVFYPFDPRPEEVSEIDIAHSLARIIRFLGHGETYTVAKHSLLASRMVPTEHAFAALIHDAAEAYFGDWIRPVKKALFFLVDGEMTPGYVVEQRIHSAICRRFGVDADMPDCVKRADNTLLATEARDIMGGQRVPWAPMPAPLPEQITLSTVSMDEFLWLKRFYELRPDIDSAKVHDTIPCGPPPPEPDLEPSVGDAVKLCDRCQHWKASVWGLDMYCNISRFKRCVFEPINPTPDELRKIGAI